MILVDTSVWIDHFRVANERLKALLLDPQVLCHPFVIGELACGMLRHRGEILANLRALPTARLIEHEEVISFLEARHLYGKGQPAFARGGLLPLEKYASEMQTGFSIRRRLLDLTKGWQWR